MHGNLAGSDTPDLTGRHGHYEQVAVWEPTEPGGTLLTHLDHRLPITDGIDGIDPVLVEVAVPESSVMPARAFAEVQAIDQQGGLVHWILHPTGFQESRFAESPQQRWVVI